MQFLKILFWCLLVFVAAVFTFGNWNTVDIHLWAGLVATVNLPLLLLVAFLAGMVPTMIYYGTIRWRLRNRLSTTERALGDLRAATAVAEPEPVVAPPPAAVPPAAAIAAPPLLPEA